MDKIAKVLEQESPVYDLLAAAVFAIFIVLACLSI